MYWGLNALAIMKRQDALNREDMIEYVMSCWDDDAGQSEQAGSPNHERYDHTPRICIGGFGAHPHHDAHIHATLSAIQILLMQDALDRLDVDRVVKCNRLHSLPPMTSLLNLNLSQLFFPSITRTDRSLATDLGRLTHDLDISRFPRSRSLVNSIS